MVRLLKSKFGELPEERRLQIESADPQTLLEWSERILTAKSIEEVLHQAVYMVEKEPPGSFPNRMGAH